MAETFNVIFRGDIAPGSTLAEVRERLRQHFNLDESRAAQLFSGRPVVVKKDLDQQRADQFCQLLAGMGAVAEVRASGDGGQAARGSPPPSPSAPVESAAPDIPSAPQPATGLEGVTIEPPGADVLRPGERPPQVQRTIATDHLTLDAPGADVLKPHERRQPASRDIDLSHLRVEPVDDD